LNLYSGLTEKVCPVKSLRLKNIIIATKKGKTHMLNMKQAAEQVLVLAEKKGTERR